MSAVLSDLCCDDDGPRPCPSLCPSVCVCVTVQAIKADEGSESLDSFYGIKLDVTRNKSYCTPFMPESTNGNRARREFSTVIKRLHTGRIIPEVAGSLPRDNREWRQGGRESAPE
jgi:hypothetical protein